MEAVRFTDQIVDGLAGILIERLSEHFLNGRRSSGGDVLSEIAAQILEAIGLGNEVGLAVDLDGHAHAVLVHEGVTPCPRRQSGRPSCAAAARPFSRRIVDGLVHIAVALDERLLAVHHAGSRCARAAP